MASRRRSREQALQILFLWDVSKQPVHEAIRQYFDTLVAEEGQPRPEREPFVDELVRGAVEHADDIDRRIAGHAEHWRLERMPAVDRNILRLAVFELLHSDTPAAVVIDEALELARRFSNEESVQFVNGVLDAVRRSMDEEGNGGRGRVTGG
jgi:N utilization substance protein B